MVFTASTEPLERSAVLVSQQLVTFPEMTREVDIPETDRTALLLPGAGSGPVYPFARADTAGRSV